jgi:hypothetical protein
LLYFQALARINTFSKQTVGECGLTLEGNAGVAQQYNDATFGILT